jgi:hypothetical protein
MLCHAAYPGVGFPQDEPEPLVGDPARALGWERR